MSSKDADKGKDKPKDKDKDKAKAQGGAPKGDAKKADAKPKEKKAKEGAEAAEAKVEKAPEPPRAPADPRMKYIKKFHGKFLPRGPLRDRHKDLMTKWNSGEEHGGVTVEQLKSLFDDWKASREKPSKKKATV
ncbi:hypothetical protein OJF2_65900 [Aquisphaera giovannonii]|uniref:Uncharacterized protein n=1 Tax=Aquisphaera giovannonii TaxID=406548 RepID=A0A5B9WCK0_9BACT|nr:hypothetical protein [Aquisphaera giovannonii]QEH37994.1 hypothetical protein OJF2_65900 [Aquisphaera giovannonii]